MASGRSTIALTRPAAGKRRRTIASAQTTPKIAFSGTAITAMISVSLNACTVLGSLSVFQSVPAPLSNARTQTIVSGPSRTASRYPSARNRRTYLRTLVPRCEEAQAADREQQREGDEEHHHGDGGRARLVAALDVQEDEHGGDLGLERRVARDQHERADLTDRARERDRDAGQDAGEDVRQHDAPEHAELTCAERTRRLLRFDIELEQHGLHPAHDDRQRYEQQREDDRLPRQRHVDPDGRPRPVEREQRQAGDDRR